MRCSSGKVDALRTEWYERADALPLEWDRSLPSQSYLLRSSLQQQEAAKLPDLTYAYAALHGRDGILAQAAFQVLRLQPEHVKADSMPAWQYQMWRLAARVLHPRLLVGGALFRHDVESLWHSPLLAPFDTFVWYRNVLQSLRQRSCAAAILLKELPAELVPYFQHQAGDYLLLRNDISMEMEIPASWQNLQDYAASLKHKYAQRFRKTRQGWQGLRVAEMDKAETLANAGALYALYRQVAEAQSVRIGFLSRDFLPGLKQAYGDRLRIWGIWETERLVAFTSGWVHPQSFDMFYIGLDYSRNADLQLYFNILFFAVEQAISLQKPLLILGRTALEAKARLGCRPHYLHTFLHVRNPILRSVVARLQARFADSGGEWEQRHPFLRKPDTTRISS